MKLSLNEKEITSNLTCEEQQWSQTEFELIEGARRSKKYYYELLNAVKIHMGSVDRIKYPI